jgi:V/A-type H+-transporting ATPase subunit D
VNGYDRDQAPTRSAVLELRSERGVVHEAYEFLDEKRLLLAAEVLRHLERYEQLLEELDRTRQDANLALRSAVMRHGLQGLNVYPPLSFEPSRIETDTRSFMGVTLVDTRFVDVESPKTVARPVNPSPEANRCRQRFRQLIALTSELAGLSVNLHRLLNEYRKTQRRTRALENVVLPEIEETLREMETRLEEMEQEDTVRVRLDYNRRAAQ